MTMLSFETLKQIIATNPDAVGASLPGSEDVPSSTGGNLTGTGMNTTKLDSVTISREAQIGSNLTLYFIDSIRVLLVKCFALG
jgi:hypothetical protein